jgi:acetyl esterase/lipase
MRRSRALRGYVPPGVAIRRDLQYNPAEADARLDIYYPAALDGTTIAMTTIVWIHGGGWISGSKTQLAEYASILASKGYIVAAVGYSLAPGRTYPTPLRQVNAAFGYLVENAYQLHIEPSRFVLAGDSAGAQIAAQFANIVSVPSYAKAVEVAPLLQRQQLRSVILFCGAYDLSLAGRDGRFDNFLKTALWSYTGERNFAADPRFAEASVIHYVTSAFPPAFISAGNADPLLAQSVAFAEALTAKSVPVESLFFPQDYTPALSHEYQFDLDTEAGRLALSRMVGFVSRLGSGFQHSAEIRGADATALPPPE